MTVDGEDVPSEEFLYLYQKNNQQQETPQSLDEYLQLFEVYRLKVAEAKQQGIDTTSGFKKEVALYKRELLEPFITDTIFFNSLVEEAMEREKNQVESSHIMIIRTHNEARDKRNLEILDSVRNEIINGANFIEMAKHYSQDKFSSDKGGYLGYSPAGTYPYGFETAVYETPEGEISEIVESHVGWHIVKSGARRPAEEFNRPPRSYSDVKEDVLKKSSSPFDTRYHKIRQNKLNRLKERHKDINVSGMSDEEAYDTLILAEEETLYKNNVEYRNLVDEYTNGSLLYEVSVDEVWNKASNDIEGLEAFYQAHKNNYKWDSPHAKGIVVQALNDSVANLIKTQIEEMPLDSVIPFVRKNFKKEAVAERFNISKGGNAMIDNLMFGANNEIKPKANLKSWFVVEGRIVENPENLQDVKGLVINDYQAELEKAWVEKLKKKHTVTVNNKELANIRKSIRK